MKIQDALHERRVPIIGISRDTAEESRAFAEKIGVAFPLVSDPELAIAEAYGVAGDEVAIPSVFVVRADKTLAWSYIGERTPDRPASQMVLEAVDAVLAGR